MVGMGGEVHQDKATTLDMVYRLVDELEIDFKSNKDREEWWCLVDQTVFILTGFLATLRGKEVFQLLLEVVRDY